MSKSEFKSTGGLSRIIAANRYSMQGLSAAFRHEAAFRQELFLGLFLIPAACFLGRSLLEVVLLIVPYLVVLIIELLNSALEALCDTITLEHHPMIGRAKDLGSAAVWIGLVMLGLVWISVAVSRFIL